MKVCVVLPSLSDGGSERAALTILGGLDAARYERTLYLFSDRGVYRDLVAPGVRVVTSATTSRLGRVFELASFLRATSPDVIMPCMSYFTAAVAARLARVPSRVVFNQGTPTSDFLADPDFSWRIPWRRRLFAFFTRLFYTRADAVVVTSEGIADDLATQYAVPRVKIRVLHNPVDVRTVAEAAAAPIEAASLDRDGPVIAAAGRLAGVKNYPLLIESVAALETPAPVHVWILGDGAERARLEALAAARGLADRVHFLGFQQNPWRFIARADVFVLTSVYEGFGNVLVEAMACGTPVVATRSRGACEIVRHENNGLLVDHEPQAVAAAIARLLGDGELRAHVVAQAREDVEGYSVPRVVQRYDRLFQELAS